MNKIFRYCSHEEYCVPIVNCFDIIDNVYEVYPFTNTVKYIDTKEIKSSYVANTGYRCISLKSKSGISKTYLLHRIIAELCIPKFNNEYNIVNHIDANKLNNSIFNLEWCTQLHNMRHAQKLGLTPIVAGENNNTAKLTNKQVEMICELMEQGIQYKYILEQVGLEINDKNLDILTKIRSRKMWNTISCKYNIPEKEFRSKAIVYSNDQIHDICKLISMGCSNRQIADKLNIDISTKKLSDKYYKFIKRIRNRESYTSISSNYIW